MGSDVPHLAPEDRLLLERVAKRVVELRLEVPALLTLESARPLSVVASQAMIFFEPLVQALLRIDDYRRFALLAERREALETLARMIEQRAEEAHETRRSARASRRARDGRDPARGDGGGSSDESRGASAGRGHDGT
jgi:hypothetical protein